MYVFTCTFVVFYVHTFSLDFVFLCHIPFHCGRTIQNKLKTKHCHKCPKPTTKHNKCCIKLGEYKYKKLKQQWQKQKKKML